MNPSVVAKIVAVVPVRASRFQSGTPFSLRGESPHAGQIACLAELLHWMSPLSTLTEDHQRVLGVSALHGKLARRDDDEDDDADHDHPMGHHHLV